MTTRGPGPWMRCARGWNAWSPSRRWHSGRAGTFLADRPLQPGQAQARSLDAWGRRSVTRLWQEPTRSLETEHELRVVRHHLGRPRRRPRQGGLDLVDALERRHDLVHLLLDHRAGRAAHRGQRVRDRDLAAILDPHVVDQSQVDDVHAQLRILDDPQRIEYLFLGDAHGSIVAVCSAAFASHSAANASSWPVASAPPSSGLVAATAARSARATRPARLSARPSSLLRG